MIKFILTITDPKNSAKGYAIEKKDDHSIWISGEDGEGAEFSAEKFYEAIDKFYRDNF